MDAKGARGEMSPARGDAGSDPRLASLRLAAAALRTRFFPTHALFAAFGTPEGILRAPARELAAVEGLTPSARKMLLSPPEEIPAEEGLARLERGGIRIVSFHDPEFPRRLREIPDPPPVLFVRGRLLAEDAFSVAVIGSRRASPYGLSICERIAQDLVRNGLSIVSGMARGVDAAAHWAGLEGGGRTLAVLGTGVDVAYPKSNRSLFERIPLQGAILSEFLPGTGPLRGNFPRRNRIISGMALGVLVVEAAERSGTMITVRTALEQGREVFAVPGDVRSPLSRGTHRLIKQGAKLVEGIEDVLEELPTHVLQVLRRASSPAGDPASDQGTEGGGAGGGRGEGVEAAGGDGEILLGWLGDEGMDVDGLSTRTGWTSERVAAVLTELELLGRVKRLPGNRFLPA